MRFTIQYQVSKDLILGFETNAGGWIFYRKSEGMCSRVYKQRHHATTDLHTGRYKTNRIAKA